MQFTYNNFNCWFLIETFCLISADKIIHKMIYNYQGLTTKRNMTIFERQE